ncbi:MULTISPECIES: TetR/AcrR family transcriptional regulator [Bacillaceae]|uniref:TetR/AcrR family transcriptional regulator n=1 Tax=Bacillaceae TaxID=186817 RepID=UPI000BA5299C|nr:MULTISPECIES: TetR/AcrR family transcriptional regulator [Bacillaceae]PAE24942.1 TetR family transcriptional regulator [Bacillus sp. 7894-2]URM32478.1 TetR/AcrR family transcriptional regulator [Cytobacillus firmus]
MPLSEQQITNMKKRRETILEAATYLFAAEGYEGTTIKKIAQAANISFGSVFTYFKDKEELFYTAVAEPLHELSVKIFDFNTDAEDPMLELEKMIRGHIKLFAGINNYLALVVQVVGQHQRYPAIFAKLDAFHDEFREKVSQLVKNGQRKGVLVQQDPLTAATLYTSLLIGIRLNSTDERYSNVSESYASSAINLFGPISK